MVSVAERVRAETGTSTRRWVGLSTAGVTWLALYKANLPAWDWLVYDIAGLDPTSRWGLGVHFFGYDSVKIVLLLVGFISRSPCCAPS